MKLTINGMSFEGSVDDIMEVVRSCDIDKQRASSSDAEQIQRSNDKFVKCAVAWMRRLADKEVAK